MKKERKEALDTMLRGYLTRLDEIRERAEKGDIDEKNVKEIKKIGKTVFKIYGEVIVGSFGVFAN